MTTENKMKYAKLVPVMLCFFAMGFVDLVGIASNYVKADLGLSDSQANIFPSLVFFWFLIFCAYGHIDESYRPKEDGAAQSCGDICFASHPDVWRQLWSDALFVLSAWHWKRVDADFAQSVVE